jgi:two-component system response regulator DesR
VLRVAIVDDSPEVRELWRAALETGGGFEVCAEGGDGAEAVEIAGRLRPDVMLLDLSMPGVGGLEALPRIRAASPGTRVVVVSSFGRRRFGETSSALGAAGFLDKHHPANTLCTRLREVLAEADGGPAAPGAHPTFGPY